MPAPRPSASRVRRTVTLAAALALAAPTLRAQARTLDWPRIDVTAHLDADGRLRVVERQTLRLTGDWNGGERRFDARGDVRLHVESLHRIDSLTGERVPMRRGSTDVVDGWVRKGRTVRWRSRLPTDPPFADTRLVHEIDVRYEQLLVPERDGGFRLDHDFAFADRAGTIDTFTVTLTIDPAWRPPADFTGRWTALALAPGQGMGIVVPLVRIAATRPAAVRLGTPQPVRWALLALLGTGLTLLVGRFVRREARLGRFVPPPPREAVTPDYLERELLAHLPEVVGAAWDGSTAQAEVAALLARLVQEGTLASRVEGGPGRTPRTPELHLELRGDPATLREHERALVVALFGDARTTSTTAIRARYKKTGFDQAATLRAPLAALLDDGTAAELPLPVPRRVTVALFVLSIACHVIGGIIGGERDVGAAVAFTVFTGVSIPVGFIAASVWRARVARLALPGAWLALALLGPMLLFAIGFVHQEGGRPGPWTLAGLVLWSLGLAGAIVTTAAARESRDRLAWRRRLAAARAFFEHELRTREPAIDDRWYPYLLAFGLGPHVDRWFKAFGGDAVRTASGLGMTTSIGGGGRSGSSATGFTGFGGGGGFSGGGGGAEFGAALGSFAASVPSPSSSSSSGGSRSSSSSSSGGGGGGGW